MDRRQIAPVTTIRPIRGGEDDDLETRKYAQAEKRYSIRGNDIPTTRSFQSFVRLFPDQYFLYFVPVWK